MGSLPPPVVAVVVVRDPGPWFEEVLAAFAAQDYADLSVLILDAAGAEDPAARVAAALPDAWVRRLPENLGFGATANVGASMVDGAAYLLFCHDDVAPDPDAVHQLVEEAFRSNAGIVTPKLVSWDDEERLLHVGMGVDKTGAVVDRVSAFEIDAGQHDAVRDVFVAPGGFTLVRSDLFAEIGGFDPAIFLMGEDLDLCWRAQVAGARVVTAPAARVRHREQLASGSRPLEVPADHNPRAVPAPAAEVEGHRDHTLLHRRSGGHLPAPVTLQELQRRHELRAVLKCYDAFHLLRILPQVVALAVGEMTVAVVAGHPARARTVARAWWWNIRGIAGLRPLRRQVKGTRVLHDTEVRRLQTRGSARLTQWLRRVVTHGFHGDTVVGLPVRPVPGENEGGEAVGVPGAPPGASAPVPQGTAEVGAGASAAAVGSAASAEPEPTVPVVGTSLRLRLAVWIVVGGIVLFGSRQLIGVRFPVIGQFVTFPGWAAALHRFTTGWPALPGGTRSPASPAYAVLAAMGFVLFGSTGLLQQVCILGCLPLGAWGVSRLLRPTGSSRARMVATAAYLLLPLPYEDIANGRWQALVLYGTVPWLLLLLARSTGVVPFDGARRPPGRLAALFAPAQSILHGGRSAHWAEPEAAPGWRSSLIGRTVLLGLVEALVLGFAPPVAVLLLVSALGLAVGSALAGEFRRSLRAVSVAIGATLVAAGLCFPWVLSTLAAGRSALGVFGLPLPGSAFPSWDALLRFASSPTGSSPLVWGFALAALLPLLIADRWRLAWAGRWWALALVAWAGAWFVDRGWSGGFVLAPEAWLVPAGVAVCAALGLGAAAFEQDLPAHRFGWRQVVTVGAVLAALVASLPTVVDTVDGRWHLPPTGDDSALVWLSQQAARGSFEVLWMGDPRAVPGAGWAAQEDQEISLTAGGVPDGDQLWAPAAPGRVHDVLADIRLAEERQTTRVGLLLRTEGIRYLVIPSGPAPVIAGIQHPASYPLPSDLLVGLDQQLDLRQITSEEGMTVLENTDWRPLGAVRSGRPLGDEFGAAGELLLWIVAVAALVGPRWWRDWWWLPLRRSRARRRVGQVTEGSRAGATVTDGEPSPGGEEAFPVAGSSEGRAK